MAEPMIRGPAEDVRDNDEARPEAVEEFYASQWKLMRRRFARHRLAMVSLAVLLLLYVSALLAPFLSPVDPDEKSLAYKEAPPQVVHFFGGGVSGPFVYALSSRVNADTYRRTYFEDTSRPHPVRFFVRGFRYRMLGFLETDIHLFGTADPNVPVHLFGTDNFGRDMFARVLYGAQVSLSVGLVGVAISFFLGILLEGSPAISAASSTR